MKLSEILGICPDFVLQQRDGKASCRYLQDDKTFCNHGKHFACELVLRRWQSGKGEPISKEERLKLVMRLRMFPREQIDRFLTAFNVMRTDELRTDQVDNAHRFVDALEREAQNAVHANNEPMPAGHERPVEVEAAPSGPVEQPEISLQDGDDATGAQKAPGARPVVADAGTQPTPADAPVEDSTEAVLGSAEIKPSESMDEPPSPPSWNEVWSYSRIECALDCGRKFWLRYVGKVPDTNPSKAFELGKLFHAGREAIDNGQPFDIDPTTLQLATLEDAAKLEVVLDAYRRLRPLQIEQSEVKIETELLDGTLMRGYVDGIGAGVLYEFKYAMDATPYTRALLNRQACCYLAAVPTAQHFAFVRASKPGQRQGKDESLDDFKARVAGIVAKKDIFEVRQWPRKVFDLIWTFEELTHAVENTRGAMARASVNDDMLPASRSVMKCPNCSYFDLCETLDGDRPATAGPLLDKALNALNGR